MSLHHIARILVCTWRWLLPWVIALAVSASIAYAANVMLSRTEVNPAAESQIDLDSTAPTSSISLNPNLVYVHNE